MFVRRELTPVQSGETRRANTAGKAELNTYEAESQSWLFVVVISQTHWLVSQGRLSPREGTSVFIDLFFSGAICEQWF